MKGLKILIVLCMTSYGVLTTGFAQNGEELFNANCAACHKIDQDFVGPSLKGAKERWEKNSSLENFYAWVKNSKAVIDAGDPYANELLNKWDGAQMTPNAISNEDIDAIFEYVKAGPVDPPPPPPTEPEEAVAQTDYNTNLNLFYLFGGLTILLLITILVLTNSILNLVKSDYFKKKVKEANEKNKAIKTIVLLLGFTFIGHTLLAASPAPVAEEQTDPLPWLLIENSHLYILVGFDLFLLMVVFYLKRLFKEFMNMTKPAEVIAQEEKEAKTVTKVLTDAVDIEDEHTILMDHEYDGIQELDNNLPPWWLWGFYISIVFAIIYLLNYHVFNVYDNSAVQYEKDMAAAQEKIDEYLEKMAMNVDENTVELLTDDGDLRQGAGLFKANCVSCHGPEGAGNIGPNLTDHVWIYGYDIKNVFKTVKYGTSNGMPEHVKKLNPKQIQQVSSYVLSLPEKEGKAAEGEIIEE